MSMTAHGFGAPGTPQEFSIGFTERSCPGRTEFSSAAEEAHAAAHAMSPGAGASTSRSPSGSAGKRKRDVTTPIDDGNTTPAFSASSAAVFGSGAATVSPKGRAPAPAAAPAPASEHGQRIQDFFRPKSALAATPSSATAAATSSAPAAHAPAPFTAAPPSSAVGPKASSARREAAAPQSLPASTATAAATTAATSPAPVLPPTASAELLEMQRQLEVRTRELAECQRALSEQRTRAEAAARAQAELDLEVAQARNELEAERAVVAGMREELAEVRTTQEAERERLSRGREALRAALRERCFRSRAEARERLARESVRLGRLKLVSRGFSSEWEQQPGTAMMALNEREEDRKTRWAQLEEDRKALRRRRGTKPACGGGAGTSEGGGPAPIGIGGISAGGSAAEGSAAEALELADLEEALNLRGSLLAKEQKELQAERRQLEREADEHFHELQLMRDLDELDPEMRDCPSLPKDTSGVFEPGASGGGHSLLPHAGGGANASALAAASCHRFVFLDLIARGGFSSVFKVYDLKTHCYTACKLHHIAQEWGAQRKEAFVRHVEREIDITVDARHRRIVQTFAVFELNANALVSVMQFCNGGSLAELLRKHGPLPEKDAKAIMHQILTGLHYLHTRREPIIHYDLKPANILFHDGEVKLSDFGLSKVMAPAAGGSGVPTQGSIELTSYGSGTHGYLPPECYEGDASRVCPKVDVFSAGVVHFVMLFHPLKPFFRTASQQQILQMKPHAIREETGQLDFPSKISAEAQAFLRRTLASKREERGSVRDLLADPYMQPQKSRATA